jgi:hypothetical protein
MRQRMPAHMPTRLPRAAVPNVSLTPQPKGISMSSVGYHEPVDELPDDVRDMHRAIVSLMEELEAVDWYNQRAAVCKDPELKAVLEHNRDEEKEHAAMTLEWIRRRDPKFNDELKDYLFTEKSLKHDAKGH